jgi:hypothetical protein
LVKGAESPDPAGQGLPDRRAVLGDAYIRIAGGLVRSARLQPETTVAEAAAALLARRGAGPYAQADAPVQYAAVNAGPEPCVVGVFLTPAAAAAYANTQGWADFLVAQYQTRPFWE